MRQTPTQYRKHQSGLRHIRRSSPEARSADSWQCRRTRSGRRVLRALHAPPDRAIRQGTRRQSRCLSAVNQAEARQGCEKSAPSRTIPVPAIIVSPAQLRALAAERSRNSMTAPAPARVRIPTAAPLSHAIDGPVAISCRSPGNSDRNSAPNPQTATFSGMMRRNIPRTSVGNLDLWPQGQAFAGSIPESLR